MIKFLFILSISWIVYLFIKCDLHGYFLDIKDINAKIVFLLLMVIFLMPFYQIGKNIF